MLKIITYRLDVTKDRQVKLLLVEL